MKLHEYQAKALLAKAELPVPACKMVDSVTDVAAALTELNVTNGLVKAQAFTGGRGKAGGVKFFTALEEAEKLTEGMLGMTLVTHQTGPEGVLVDSVLITVDTAIETELYLAMMVDRTKGSVVIMLSEEGGMEIEEIAEEMPEKILKLYPSIVDGITSEISAEAAAFMNLKGSLATQFDDMLKKLFKVFVERDCTLLEINPLVINDKDELKVLDCKFEIDDNAVFRQGDSGGDPVAEKSENEVEADKYNMSYIELDGNIGCMVNGAGLAMATMDIIKYYGQEPANFLDVGGSATEEAVTEAFKLISSDVKVKAILVNIFGGIMKCDIIANGIIAATKKIGLTLPLVVRLEGTNVDEGLKIINESGLNIVGAKTMADGAQKVSELV
ncbi:MAG: ADP-forming succinate--CoA ligase subunit beta [Fibrobacterales bacterium]